MDDEPYVRAMMLIYREDRFFFVSGNIDKKVSQITRNPVIEVCISIGKDEGSLRLRGKIRFITDEDTREEVHGCAGFIQGFWEDPQDPDFVFMEFKPEKLELMRPGTVEIVRGDF